MVDFNKVISAAMVPVALALVLNLILVGASMALALAGYGVSTNVVQKSQPSATDFVGFFLILFAQYGLTGIALIGTFAIVVYGGYAAAKKGNDLLGCGLVGLVTYGLSDPVISIARIVGEMVLGLGTGVLGGNLATGALSSIFGAMFGLGILLLGIGWWVCGCVLNLAIAAIAGMLGGAK